MRNSKSLEDIISHQFPKLGVNKKREISRLIYEIAKRDGRDFGFFTSQIKGFPFEKAKDFLLKLRYPKAYPELDLAAVYLPKLEISDQENIAPPEFSPKQIYIDYAVKDSVLACRIKDKFPHADVEILKEKKTVGSADYSKRTETVYITEEKYDFVKRCPCTSGAAGCGYNLINLGFGCRFECQYCFLQEYQNQHAIIMPANIGDFFKEIDNARLNKGPFERIRIGSGEFTDSLVFDDITEYSKEIISFFKERPLLDFEFKTKSVNIDNILNSGVIPNIVVAWSVNAENLMTEVERYTPSLSERLSAADKVAGKGYRVAFHFDPVIIHDNWQENYLNTIKKIAASVPADRIAWISMGTLRFNRGLKKIIERRFPFNKVLDEEFFLGFDGKMRYSDAERKKVYDTLLPELKNYFPKSKIYLCMEKYI
ncbi:spore photoproduct lyase [Parelusimicrobium proximum]|uniref:SPL family radical SAM protein n=1 Tax=Parelusimicrobium proximum TaxID=3228953 RepID=UPI003D17AD66